jgi:hypothetical protein
MKEGAWINVNTGKFEWVDEHASWIKRELNAEAIGLPKRIYQKIMDMDWDFDGPGRAEILYEVMKGGFIRMRGHGSYWTFEFTCDSYKALWCCLDFLMNYAGPYTNCRFSNLRTRESIELSFNEFQRTMAKEPELILRQAKILTETEYPERRFATFRSPLLGFKEASGYPRLMNILKGKVPSIHTFGIISVDNPQGTVVAPEENNKKQTEFKQALSHAGYGYVQHKGKYGEFERAFFIMNISITDLLKWKSKFDQDSVIFGRVDQEEHKVIFKLIGDDGTRSVREDVLSLSSDAEEYYSEYKGRRFLIPFFDDAYEPKNTESNIPIEILDKNLEENQANLPHLATIMSNAEGTKLDAEGLKIGMGNYYTRCSVLAALRHLAI